MHGSTSRVFGLSHGKSVLTIVICSGSESGRGDATRAVASVCPVGQSTYGRTVTFMPGAA